MAKDGKTPLVKPVEWAGEYEENIGAMDTG